MDEDFGTPFGATTLLAGAPTPPRPSRQGRRPGSRSASAAPGRTPPSPSASTAALLAFCEQERVTRVRRAAAAGALPAEALEVALRAAGCAGSAGVMTYATADDVRVPVGVPLLSLDHHAGHAAAAFRLSSDEAAAVLVCDRRRPPSVWRHPRVPWSNGPGPRQATASRGCIRRAPGSLFGSGQEHELEGLARLDTGAEASRLEELIVYRDGSLWASAAWKEHIAGWLAAGPPHDCGTVRVLPARCNGGSAIRSCQSQPTSVSTSALAASAWAAGCSTTRTSRPASGSPACSTTSRRRRILATRERPLAPRSAPSTRPCRAARFRPSSVLRTTPRRSNARSTTASCRTSTSTTGTWST